MYVDGIFSQYLSGYGASYKYQDVLLHLSIYVKKLYMMAMVVWLY